LAKKNWKRAVALFMILALVIALAPGVPQKVSADTADTTTDTTDAAAASDGETAEEDTEQEQQNVNDSGEVVQENSVGKVDKSQWITKKDYQLMAESDTYKLYLYEPRLSILLENKETGKVIESTLSDEKDDGTSNAAWAGYMKSGVVIDAIMNNKNANQVDLNTCQNTTEVTKIDNGFSEKIYFTDYQFGLTVNVTLEDDNLVVNVPDDSIVEDKEGVYISTVALFPFMDYSHLDEEDGYMLVPDGNGALINLDNKEGRYTSGFSQMIYGSDAGFTESDTKEYLWDELDMLENSNQVIAPIFGMAHTQSKEGFFAVVEKGEKRAKIVAEPNGVSVNYNRCYARFLLRDIYVQPLNTLGSGEGSKATQSTEANRTHSDLQVRYMLLSGDDANYSAMATKYRKYLLDNELVTKKDPSYKTRVDFLGTDREKFLLGTKAVTMTKADDISDIFKELQSDGVSSLLSVYKGWQDGGLYDLPIKKYDADSHIGGNSDLTKLIKDSASSNYDVYLYNDALRLNPKTNLYNFGTIKKVAKTVFEEEIWAEVYKTFNYLTPAKTSENLQSLVKSAAKSDVSQIALAGISNSIFSYSYKGSFYTRNDTADTYSETINSLDANTDFVMEQPSAYLWKNTDAFLDMPLGDSGYMYVDEEVPFLSMVLKGISPMYSEYVNFEANKQEFLLEMVESGVYPSFYITKENSSALIYTNSADLYSTEYSTYKDTIEEFDKTLRELNDAIGDATIEKHEIRDNGVKVVTYSNGVKVYVNYGDEDQTVDGKTVGAMSYSYKAGEAE
jgi:hypothetical protein